MKIRRDAIRVQSVGDSPIIVTIIITLLRNSVLVIQSTFAYCKRS